MLADQVTTIIPNVKIGDVAITAATSTVGKNLEIS